MARIARVVPSGQTSNFRQAAPEAGGAFRFMAEVAETAYSALAPAAEQEMDARAQVHSDRDTRGAAGLQAQQLHTHSAGRRQWLARRQHYGHKYSLCAGYHLR